MKPARSAHIREATPDAGEFKVETVSDYRSFLELDSDWNNLVRKAKIDHPFLSHEWVRIWWQCFGTGKTLHIVTARRGGELVAIAPMMLRRARIYGFNLRVLEFIYNECTERFDFIVARNPREAYNEIWNSFVKQKHLWDLIRLCQVPAGSMTLEEIPRLARGDGLLAGVWRSSDAPHVKLTGSWESYFHSLRSKLRANLRRRLKGLSQLGKVEHEVVRAGDQLQPALEEGLRIEAASWKGKEGTAIRCTPEVHKFYTNLAEVSAQRGWLWLDFLTVNNRRIAFDYSLRYHNKQYLLKTGYDPEYAQHSPYHLLLWRVLQRMFDNGVGEFDFMGVNDSWKQDWSRDTTQHYWLYLFPNQIRMRLIHGLKFRIIPRLRQHRLLTVLRGAGGGRRVHHQRKGQGQHVASACEFLRKE